MLDRTKILTELTTLADKLFLNIDSELQTTSNLWQGMIDNQQRLLELATAMRQKGLPTWSGNLDASISIPSCPPSYQVLAIDGSQIYPDKHQGTGCFVINIGGVILRYGTTESSSKLWSEPFVFMEEKSEEDTATLHDIVNGKREEFEFQIGLQEAISLRQEHPDLPLLFLFDGSLVFWHLYNKNSAIKDYFIERYTQLLEQFYAHNILIAGYLSLTKARDITQLMQFYAGSILTTSPTPNTAIAHIDDAVIMRYNLNPHERSTIFKSNSPVTETMPAHLHPHFFYYDTGYEIVRIEIPGYQAGDEKKINMLASLLKNQVEKGLGYPIALAEAHEQAVIKAGDRHMFYQLIDTIAIDKKKYLIPSQKNMKKRRMNV